MQKSEMLINEHQIFPKEKGYCGEYTADLLFLNSWERMPFIELKYILINCS